MKRRILSAMLALVLCLGLTGAARAEGQRTVYASTMEELQAALASNTKIVLEGKDYVGSIYIEDMENVTIEGTAGTRIVCADPCVSVIAVNFGTRITFSNLGIGHLPYSQSDLYDEPYEVVYAINTEDLVFNDCEMFNNGNCGVYCSPSSITFNRTTIRDCGIAGIFYYEDVSFNDCVFSDNGQSGEYSLFIAENDVEQAGYIRIGNGVMNFFNCIFRNNRNPRLLEPSDDEYYENMKTYYNNCTFYGNGWGGDNAAADPGIPASTTPAATTAPAQTETVTAAPTASTVLVNGLNIPFDAYNIGGANYFKLRDLACVLSGTEKQFAVGWDAASNTITLTSGQPYTTVGGELLTGASQAQSAAPTASKIIVNGSEVSLTAYNIGGANYFKLRDIGQLFDFGIGWDNDSKIITIDSSTGYVE